MQHGFVNRCSRCLYKCIHYPNRPVYASSKA